MTLKDIVSKIPPREDIKVIFKDSNHILITKLNPMSVNELKLSPYQWESTVDMVYPSNRTGHKTYGNGIIVIEAINEPPKKYTIKEVLCQYSG